ncbi:MAG: GTP-binding protein [Erysipelotrichaceae bacterium]|nr:GTP-binding protein [Erysipelotrichaceae bacterium]
MIKIDVISGFLGAGKTTLIKKLFESGFNGEKIVLIENEFGEIGIDGGFLKESGIEIKEINSGCICCSLVGDFASSITEIIEKFNPERIIVEPSGVGKLSDIINAIKEIEADVKLNILATVVDGAKAKVYLKNFGEFFINQVDAADTIIINKVDKLSDEKLLEVVNLIKDKNDHANIITTPIDTLTGEKLLKILEEKVSLKEELIKQIEEEHDRDCCCHEHYHEHHEHDHDCCCHEHHHEHHEHDHDCCCHEHHHEHHEHDHDCCCHEHHHEHHEHDHDCCCHEHHHEHHEHDHDCCCHEHHHHADEVFTSWGIETPLSISKEELESFLNKLANNEDLGIIIRAKGILAASDNESWYYFDYVSGEYEIRLGSPDYTGRICVIGSRIDEHKIEELFYKRG